MQALCNPQDSGGEQKEQFGFLMKSPGTDDTSLDHMIREFSPKTISLPPLIHFILILATLPRLQVQGSGGETLSTALKTQTHWHIPLSRCLEGDITGSVDE